MENVKQDSEIVGIVLAAGFSSRMGAFKPLLQIGDRTAVEWIADTLKEAGIRSGIAVTGHHRELLCPILEKKGIREAYNQEFEKGMFTSVQRGIGEALDLFPEGPAGYFLMLADSPLISPGVLRLIMDKHREQPDAFIVPCYHGKKGHPLFIPYRYTGEILSHGGEGGLKAITGRYEEKMIRLEVNDESVVLDMDTPEAYRELLDYYEEHLAAGEGAFPLEHLLKGKRLFLVRHGETRQHSEKIFLGQADIPLSERGRDQAEEAAEELLRCQADPGRIFTSDLVRAAETAGIIRDRLNLNRTGREIPMITDSRLREIALGEWDGCFIREIKERYPEEYKKRGDNLLTYKFDHNSENFYDLQYRAMKALRSILKQEMTGENGDGSRDIVIVSHWGVINVILCRLRGLPLEEEVRRPMSNGGIIALDCDKLFI